MGIFDAFKKKDAAAEQATATPLVSPDELDIEGNDVESTGITMDELENLVSKVLKSNNTNIRLGAGSDSGSTSNKVLFKGIKQLLADDFESLKEDDPDTLKGYLNLVRDSSTSERGVIYFGTRRYGLEESDFAVIDCGTY